MSVECFVVSILKSAMFRLQHWANGQQSCLCQQLTTSDGGVGIIRWERVRELNVNRHDLPDLLMFPFNVILQSKHCFGFILGYSSFTSSTCICSVVYIILVFHYDFQNIIRYKLIFFTVFPSFASEV